MNTEALQIAEAQRLDAEYYATARAGYDPTTGERDTALQRYAAKRSRSTRERLFELIDWKSANG